eukprot:TRINITY_DN1389_c0_g1_i2.p2 TRINITY_DN1389_c0_g1~~TRINITY_DN1389_c0_g1_i2.p2  ORF type:complete len:101 (+),score=4.91 TRINITY_DN1389_c0_g1_i2:281-583(+)
MHQSMPSLPCSKFQSLQGNVMRFCSHCFEDDASSFAQSLEIWEREVRGFFIASTTSVDESGRTASEPGNAFLIGGTIIGRTIPTPAMKQDHITTGSRIIA